MSSFGADDDGCSEISLVKWSIRFDPQNEDGPSEIECSLNNIDRSGDYISPGDISAKLLRGILRKAGLPRIRFHMSSVPDKLVLFQKHTQQVLLSNAGNDIVRKSLSQGLVGFELLDPLHLLPIPFILRIRCCEPRIQNFLGNGFWCRS